MNIENLRIGNGFDFHRLSENTGDFKIFLGGVEFDFYKQIIAHSDGDVILHALCEAIFGAMASGNIGSHFPPNDARWKKASSTLFAEYAMKLLKEKNGKILNLDFTVICEEPKIMPHSLKIRENLSKMLNIGIEKISIKATTTEGMGFLGRKEGIGCFATGLFYIEN